MSNSISIDSVRQLETKRIKHGLTKPGPNSVRQLETERIKHGLTKPSSHELRTPHVQVERHWHVVEHMPRTPRINGGARRRVALATEEDAGMGSQLLVRRRDGALGDAGGRGDVAHGLAAAGALHHHVDDRGGDGLRVAPHVEALLEAAHRVPGGAHVLVAQAEPGAEAAEVVGGAHDADVHRPPLALVAEVLLDEGGEPADLLLGGGALGGDGGELLVRPRHPLVAARDEEAGGVDGVAVPAAREPLGRLAELLEHLLGAVADGGDEAEAVGHVGDAPERGDERGRRGRADDVDPPPRQQRGGGVGGGGVLGRCGGVGDGGAADVVGEEGVGAVADAVGVAVVAGAVVGEGAPLGRLVDVARVEDERALGADGVAGGVVEHHRRRAPAVRAVGPVVRRRLVHLLLRSCSVFFFFFSLSRARFAIAAAEEMRRVELSWGN